MVTMVTLIKFTQISRADRKCDRNDLPRKHYQYYFFASDLSRLIKTNKKIKMNRRN